MQSLKWGFPVYRPKGAFQRHPFPELAEKKIQSVKIFKEIYRLFLLLCGLQGECPGVVGTLVSMPPRGEGFLGGSLVTPKLEGGL